MNGKSKYAIFILVAFGAIFFLGPVIISSEINNSTIGDIPTIYVYLISIWLIFIISNYLVSQKFSKDHDSN